MQYMAVVDKMWQFSLSLSNCQIWTNMNEFFLDVTIDELSKLVIIISTTILERKKLPYTRSKIPTCPKYILAYIVSVIY